MESPQSQHNPASTSSNLCPSSLPQLREEQFQVLSDHSDEYGMMDRCGQWDRRYFLLPRCPFGTTLCSVINSDLRRVSSVLPAVSALGRDPDEVHLFTNTLNHI